MTIALHRHTVRRWLASTTALLLLASVAGTLFARFTGHDYVFGLIPLFNVDLERNVPTAFSVFLLYAASALLLINAAREWRQIVRAVCWAGLGLIFAALATDEWVGLHEAWDAEILETAYASTVGVWRRDDVSAWSILGVLVGGLGLWLLMKLPLATRYRFILAAFIYVGGVSGVDFVLERFHAGFGPHDYLTMLLVTLEEGMEMSGVVLFIDALLGYGSAGDQYTLALGHVHQHEHHA